LTFAECAAAYIAGHEGGWRSRRHHQQWVRTLEVYAYPILGDLPVSEVTREHVLKVLQPIWFSRTETAATLRGRIELVLSWAAYMGYRDGANPAIWRGGLDHALPSKRKVASVVHRPALAYAEVPAFIAELRQRDGMAGKCLEFLILTAVRAGEAIGAKWSEIDLQTRTWVIPRERTKKFREHRVPLSEAASALLARLPRQGEYVFVGYHGRVLSVASLRALLLRMGFAHQFCTHGFRASFSSWARETTSYPREIVEAALAHVVGDVVERSYARGDALERRRALMEAWASYCMAAPAKVVRLRGVA
jgi:integrase